MMKISGPSAFALLLGHGSTCTIFNPSFIDVPRTRIRLRAEKSAASFSYIIRLPCLDHSRRRTKLRTSQSSYEPEVPSRTPQADEEQIITSRREVLRQCSSIFSATVYASIWSQREANALEFSETALPPVLVDQPPPRNTAPKFYDESVITPPEPQVVRVDPKFSTAPSESSVAIVQQVAPENNPILPQPFMSTTTASIPPPHLTTEVTLENSHVVQLPVANPAPTQASSAAIPAKTSSGGGGKIFIAEVVAVTTVLCATASAVGGKIEPNTDDLSPKCKVVMIENEPYGLGKGRRFFKGVDVTINDPVPASDIREYCEAGQVNEKCTETIAGFLGEVSTNQEARASVPSVGQQQTAAEVLSYLNSLDSGSHAASKTEIAFSSYLNVLSNGKVDAPASPKLVADYLDSVSRDDIRRLTTVENKLQKLESSVDQFSDEISGRLERWQEKQDEQLKNELIRIESFLVNASSPNMNGVNREGSMKRLPFR